MSNCSLKSNQIQIKATKYIIQLKVSWYYGQSVFVTLDKEN